MGVRHFLLVFLSILMTVSIVCGQQIHSLYWSTKNTSINKPMLLYMDEDPQIWVAKIKAGNSVKINQIEKQDEGTHSFGSLATSMYSRGVYWADSVNRNIEFINDVTDGVNSIKTINLPTSKQVNGMAIDWVNDNIFWTDSLYNWIMVLAVKKATFDHNILIDTDLVTPHGIAVHAQKSFLFWSDSGTGKIERSSLAAGDRTVIYRGLTRPTSVCVDTSRDQLYWLDPGASRLYRSDLSGTSDQVYYSGLLVATLVGLTVHENLLMSAVKLNKNIAIWDTNQPPKTDPIARLSLNVPFPIYDLKMLSSQQQPNMSSPCSDSDNNCHICVSSKNNTEADCVCKKGFANHPITSGCVQRHYIIDPPSYVYISAERICTMPVWKADDMNGIVENCFARVTRASDIIGMLHTSDDHTYLYVTSTTEIKMARIASNSGTLVPIVSGSKNISGLAIDWLHLNLYWLEGDERVLYTSRYDGSSSVVLHRGMTRAHALAIHPPRRKLFWSEQSPTGSIIRSSNLAGNAMTTIVTVLGVIGQITIDLVENKIFWTDTTNNRIELSGLDGSARSVFYSQGKPYGLATFQDYIAWTDNGSPQSAGLHWAIKATKEKVNHFQGDRVRLGLGMPGVIIAVDVHIDKYSTTDGCSINNGGCNQLCLAGSSAQEKTCMCTLGFSLMADGRTCQRAPQPRDNFLLAAASGAAHIYQLDTTRSGDTSVFDVLADLDGIPIALDYDYKNEMVFWTDVRLKEIRRAPLAGGPVTTIARLSLTSVPEGMALDVEAEYIYYTDTGLDVIASLTFSGTGENILVNTGLDQPRAIALHPAIRTMFWTDWGASPKIEKANMNGTDRATLISTDMLCPNGLTLDLKESKIFWCDCILERVEMVNLDGSNRITLLEEVGVHYFGLAVDSNYIYISDWTTRFLKRLHRTTKNLDKEWKFVGLSRVNGMVMFSNVTIALSSTTSVPSAISTMPSSISTLSTGTTTHRLVTPHPSPALPFTSQVPLTNNMKHSSISHSSKTITTTRLATSASTSISSSTVTMLPSTSTTTTTSTTMHRVVTSKSTKFSSAPPVTVQVTLTNRLTPSSISHLSKMITTPRLATSNNALTTNKMADDYDNSSVMIVSMIQTTARDRLFPPESNMNKTEEVKEENTLYVIAGCSLGGLFIISVTILVVAYICRRKPTGQRAEPYGVTYNGMYEELNHLYQDADDVPSIQLVNICPPDLPERTEQSGDYGYEKPLISPLPTRNSNAYD